MSLSHHTAFVTGASGHLGGALVRRLLEREWRVLCLVHRDRRALVGLDIELLQGDLNELQLEPVIAGASAVFHLAGRIPGTASPGTASYDVNRLGTERLIEACRRTAGVRLVHVSSVHARRPGPDGRVAADSPLALGPGAQAYDHSKAQAEAAVLSAVQDGLDGVVISPAACLGPPDPKPSPMGSVLRDLAAGRLPILVRAGYVWVDVRDVAAAAERAALSAPTSGPYLLGGRYATLHEIASLVDESTGRRRRRWQLPLGVAAAFAPIGRLVAGLTRSPARFDPESIRILREACRLVDAGPAARDLGFDPRPLRETVADTIAWAAEQSSE